MTRDSMVSMFLTALLAEYVLPSFPFLAPHCVMIDSLVFVSRV